MMKCNEKLSCFAKKILRSECGQVATEYILILIVMIGVVLGGVYQLNDAFRKFADNYFGDYLACLIESGELPALGGGGRSASGCNQVYQEFSIASGRPLVGKALTGEETGEIGESGGGAGDEDSGVYTGSGGGSAVVQSSPSSDFGSTSPSRFRIRRAAPSVGEEGDSGQNTGSLATTDLSGYESGKSISIPIRDREGYRRFYGADKDDKEAKKTTKVDSKTVAAEQRKGPEMIKVNRAITSTAEAPDIEEFTFGKLFRYLIIAAIVIAILIFIGGQVLQVSKSV